MRRIWSIGILLCGMTMGLMQPQHVRVLVRVPADTPAGETIYLAGSLPSVGGWKADGVKLTRQADGTHMAEVELGAGQTLEFKITRGTWETVEKNPDGSERANRSITIDESTKLIEITVARWAGASEQHPSTVVGTLRLHEIDSANLKARRTIRVWLPPGYDADPAARLAVLYMHDGQNCFDRATSAFGNEWEIDESLTKLIDARSIRPIVVVGIDNGQANRINEMTYDADARHGGGGAAAYTRFILEEVKPLVERTYRVQTGAANTYMGGSSLGGLISLEIVKRHPNTFGGVIAMSPALWWNEQSLTQRIADDPGGLRTARVWLDIGARETTVSADSERWINAARRLDATLTTAGVVHRLVIDDTGEHNEPAWARRFPDAIQYLLKD